jgi:hypothetical protein
MVRLRVDGRQIARVIRRASCANSRGIKRVVEHAHAQERTHPVFISLPEQLVSKAREREDLSVGHCSILFGSREQRLVTTPYPKPRITDKDLEPVTERYAQTHVVPMPAAPIVPTVKPVAISEPRMLTDPVF